MSFLGLPVLSKADVVSLVLQGCILQLHDQNVICAIRDHRGVHSPKSIQVLANRCGQLSHVDGQSLRAKFVPREVLKHSSVRGAPQRHALLLGGLGAGLQSDFKTLWNVKRMLRRQWFNLGSTLLLPCCLQSAIKHQERWSSGIPRRWDTRRQPNWTVPDSKCIILPKYIIWKCKWIPQIYMKSPLWALSTVFKI